MIRFAKVVLYVVVLCWNAQLDELVLECAGLLKEAMHFTINLHNPLKTFRLVPAFEIQILLLPAFYSKIYLPMHKFH